MKSLLLILLLALPAHAYKRDVTGETVEEIKVPTNSNFREIFNLLNNKMDFRDARIKVGTFTSLAFPNTGDVTVTGVGFKPRLIILYNADDNARLVFGACTSPTEDFSGGIFEGASASMSGSSCFYYLGGAPTAVLKSMDSNGFTLTFSGTNANFDTETIGYIAFQ